MNYENLNRCLMHNFNPKETKKLLQSSGNKFNSWKPTKFVTFGNKGFLFNVNARHHRGYVFLTYGWDDTYSIFLVSNDGKIDDEIEGVTADLLVDMIDRHIEKDNTLRF